MDAQLPGYKQRLSSTDVVIAVFVPYIAFLLAAFYLTRPESRDRGYRVLGISLAAGAIHSLAWWALFGGVFAESRLTDPLFSWVDRIARSESTRPWLIWGFILSVVVPFTLVHLVRTGRQALAWRRLAARAGLEFKPAGCLSTPRAHVAGTYRGRVFDLYTYCPTTEDNVLNIVHVELSVSNPGDGYLRLDHTPIASAVGSLLSPDRQIRTGDEVFDRQFDISSKPPPFATTVLASPRLREGLLLLREGTTIELQGEHLSLERAGLESDGAYLEHLLDLLSELAEAVERTDRAP